jgi:hypothetical protein
VCKSGDHKKEIRNNRKDARYQKAGNHSDEKTERRELLQGIFARGQENIPCARSPELFYQFYGA